METKRNNIPNGTKIVTTNFKDILQEMMKLTKSGNLNLRTTNSSWDIFAKPSSNNPTYSNYSTGA